MKDTLRDAILERTSIVEVVEYYTQLKKSGNSYKGKSPFTNEKTPSFFVSPDKNLYYCFSSQQGGDIFRFIQEIEGTDFPGALRFLAEKVGIDPNDYKKNVRHIDTSLYKVTHDTLIFFRQHKDIAYTYLTKRGLTKECIDTFEIGAALDGWSHLYDNLTSLGHTKEQMVEAGVIIKKDKEEAWYDRFRNRIMFPIFDVDHKVIGFGGRVIKEGETPQGKYINTPETPLYKKSRVLYGIHIARSVIKKHDFVILTEGYLDVMFSHQAGFSNTVAVCGTALTPQQIGMLSRATKNIIFAFDNDTAGNKAMYTSTPQLLQAGFNVKTITTEEGKDPADIIAEDPAIWKKHIRDAISIIEYTVTSIKKLGEEKQLSATKDKLIPLIAAMSDALAKDKAITYIEKELGFSRHAIEESLIGHASNTYTHTEKKVYTPSDIKTITYEVLGILAYLHEKTGVDSKDIEHIIKVSKKYHIPIEHNTTTDALLFRDSVDKAKGESMHNTEKILIKYMRKILEQKRRDIIGGIDKEGISLSVIEHDIRSLHI